MNKLFDKLTRLLDWYVDKCDNHPLPTFLCTFFAVILILAFHKILVLAEDLVVILWEVCKLLTA